MLDAVLDSSVELLSRRCSSSRLNLEGDEHSKKATPRTARARDAKALGAFDGERDERNRFFILDMCVPDANPIKWVAFLLWYHNSELQRGGSNGPAAANGPWSFLIS